MHLLSGTSLNIETKAVQVIRAKTLDLCEYTCRLMSDEARTNIVLMLCRLKILIRMYDCCIIFTGVGHLCGVIKKHIRIESSMPGLHICSR